ncbi:hypothetical protein DPMN_191439 [Dreissena polymorpha]|uniref:Uncharacterized protein n=1 Tax=Dreissena polymorpha TaxID=45954 RepID=A0A9D3Y237_DREPO|nr:hypothetical protein DPMN_191439 [Dreissena polymorpha]
MVFASGWRGTLEEELKNCDAQSFSPVLFQADVQYKYSSGVIEEVILKQEDIRGLVNLSTIPQRLLRQLWQKEEHSVKCSSKFKCGLQLKVTFRKGSS